MTATTTILAANEVDVAAAQAAGEQAPLIDRLRLDAPRLAALAAAGREVQALPDPVGSLAGLAQRPSGICVGRMRAMPLCCAGAQKLCTPIVHWRRWCSLD